MLIFLVFSARIDQGYNEFPKNIQLYLKDVRGATKVMDILHRDNIEEGELPPL